jgi:hypothetical protein
MESGLPRNIYTTAHSSRRVLTRHLIYHLLDPPNICEKIGSTCIVAGPIIVRIDIIYTTTVNSHNYWA